LILWQVVRVWLLKLAGVAVELKVNDNSELVKVNDNSELVKVNDNGELVKVNLT